MKSLVLEKARGGKRTYARLSEPEPSPPPLSFSLLVRNIAFGLFLWTSFCPMTYNLARNRRAEARALQPCCPSLAAPPPSSILCLICSTPR